MNARSPVLTVEKLTVYQGKHLAVRDVSFELLSGTNTAIVGANGAGKSTLVQAILNLIKRSSGKVDVFNRPIEQLKSLRSQIGYMPQNFVFDRSFPICVRELVGMGWVKNQGIAFFSRQHKQQRQAAITQALRRVGGAHLQHRAIGTLSGGELKRVLLAYCLVMPRKLLILDEAFAGVDVQGTAEFYQLLDQLKQEEDWTILQVSHDIDMVSRYCDRVICFNQTIVADDTPIAALSQENLLATYNPTTPKSLQHQTFNFDYN
jgi:zinc/manganese transport system ATP-binding protein